uniref:hypothetical protein n=1 Tax=Salmonella sp. s47020 TaxID=3159647 RepID=UPI003981215B
DKYSQYFTSWRKENNSGRREKEHGRRGPDPQILGGKRGTAGQSPGHLMHGRLLLNFDFVKEISDEARREMRDFGRILSELKEGLEDTQRDSK